MGFHPFFFLKHMNCFVLCPLTCIYSMFPSGLLGIIGVALPFSRLTWFLISWPEWWERWNVWYLLSWWNGAHLTAAISQRWWTGPAFTPAALLYQKEKRRRGGGERWWRRQHKCDTKQAWSKHLLEAPRLRLDVTCSPCFTGPRRTSLPHSLNTPK